MCVDMCVDRRLDMSVDMSVDMCVDICVDRRLDMCVDMYYLRTKTEVRGALSNSKFLEKWTKHVKSFSLR